MAAGCSGASAPGARAVSISFCSAKVSVLPAVSTARAPLLAV